MFKEKLSSELITDVDRNNGFKWNIYSGKSDIIDYYWAVDVDIYVTMETWTLQIILDTFHTRSI